ncbi:MAG: hypothetical protein P1V35_10040 [Planctomycetota bacterium]|nr:hypothetical protein [Planctomycetota bacterium]
MGIVKIEGRNLREALESAKDKVGESAVVISRKKGQGRVLLAVADAPPKSSMALLTMRQEARSLLSRDKITAGPNTAGIERCLRGRGASKALIERVCDAVSHKAADGAHPLDLAVEELATAFPIAGAKHVPGQTSILAFVGSAGAGKTTSLAKLAGHLVRSGRRVVMVSLDVNRVGAVEQIRALGKHVTCPTLAARDVLQVMSLLQGDKRPDVVLLDTSGISTADGEALRRLQTALAENNLQANLGVYLVAEITMRPVVLEEELDKLGQLPIHGCILTKADETRKPAPVLEFLARRNIGVGFVSAGRDLKQDLQRATGEIFANLMLKGRVL